MKHGARFTSSIPIVAAMLLSLAALFFTATPATAQGSVPQISITPTTLTAGQQATITGANFFPAGTAVQLFWETAKGSILRTFIVPATALPGVSYIIEAVVGGSQPPVLSASAPFTYTTPAHNLTPTPSPVPSRTSTPTLSPTAAATKGTTPTVGSTAPAATQNPTTSQTPVLNTTSNDSSNTGGTTPLNQPGSVLLIAGVIGSLVLLIALLAIVLLIRHKKARSRKMIRRATPAVGLNTNGVSPWQNGLSASPPLGNGMPGQFSPASAWVAPPVNGGQVVSTNNGAPHGGNKAAPPSSKPLPFTPYTQLLQQSVGGSVDAGKPVLAPYDPTLEAMKRQAQIGLFAVPGQHGDERPPSRQ